MVTVTSSGCAPQWSSGKAGNYAFTVENQTSHVGEINLINAYQNVVGEIETIGPDTSAPLTVTLGDGTYAFKCYMSGMPPMASKPVQLSGETFAAPPLAVQPVTVQQLTGPNQEYEAYAATTLGTLAVDVATVQADLRRGDLAAARVGWLAAQLDWERTGASYDSFAALGLAVDGLPVACPTESRTRTSPGCTGWNTACITGRAPPSCCRSRTSSP